MVTKLLFICSRNEIRSLTAERMFSGSPQFQARSAGTQPQARVRVTEGLIGWADIVFAMEKSHVSKPTSPTSNPPRHNKQQRRKH